MLLEVEGPKAHINKLLHQNKNSDSVYETVQDGTKVVYGHEYTKHRVQNTLVIIITCMSFP